MSTWGQLGILSSSPVILLSVAGYFTPIRDWLDNSVRAGFVSEQNRGYMTVLEAPKEGIWGEAALRAVRAFGAGVVPHAFDWSGKEKK